ncbi:alpha/beta fold hydrolase [Ruegeria arenilitoris]
MLWQEIPKTSLAVVPGCAHAVHAEKPELFQRLVSDFLE